jgi:predicted RND superfamily exporter protein
MIILFSSQGHTFMTCEGTRDERVTQTLSKIGPAVLSGGFSTFLSLSVLALSKSYVFMVFFKVSRLLLDGALLIQRRLN